MRDFRAELEKRREQGLYRWRRQVETPQQPDMVVDGRPVLSFCSNDYLGLANDPDAIAAARDALPETGLGGGASHLICGHHSAHHRLEETLARFTGRESALFFSTGYMANMGVISALAGRGDTIFSDRLNHASLIDGCILSRATVKRYPHCDMTALEEQLATTDGHKLVVTDGVFSMDGDVAPLPEMAALCRKHDALLVVDDAHGFGCVGPEGRGSVAHFGLGSEDVPIVIGTLGKAFGTSGAFVAGSAMMVDYLVQKARTYIYTTAMPPAVALASCTSVRLVKQADDRREHLARLINRFRREAQALGYTLMPSDTPIQPILLGDAWSALALSKALEGRGIWVTAIRPPTVPEGESRLRVTFSASHTEAHLDKLLTALGEAQQELPGHAA
ncbi:8-amino-7-oxononanoate synthase [Marinobacter nanhaiticus D15-8W]|uniref:8-amino-7-oxononanoate synthase n=1 Tax=Marinobacter nanhaiticus D15-8W TaxID=626887 RepID=N6WQK1_9GAMM|nr:8-amino-7-oxononanoate synthase [Marinobacter nanhaiticus]ENO13322.1 8-amino-7-oxononanoate synthase [Marinobacter nanhaiticus D15-8W]BES70690.1 8-amino-7-oxononanoate synthase [Marinobacter nanhaiticus D15-8W]